MEEFELPLISTHPATQLAYENMRFSGESHKMAEMLALRQGPALETDSAFLEGHCNGNQFLDRQHMGDFYKKKAEAHGQNTQGKVYLSSIAAFPGDPQAWVSSRAEVKKLISDRNWSCDGMVRHKGIKDNDQGQRKVDLAPDILEKKVANDLIKNPELAPTPKEKAEYREKVREQLSPQKVIADDRPLREKL